MYNRDRARFDAADIDKDGKLTEGEFLLFKNPLKDENVKAVVIDEALKAVDTDGDGKISLEEYLNDWHVKVSPAKPSVENKIPIHWISDTDTWLDIFT